MPRVVLLFVLVGITAGCAAFGKPEEAQAPPPTAACGGDVVVTMTEFAFSPADIEVPVGTTVEWANVGEHGHGPGEVRGKWSIGNVLPGTSWCHTFTAADVYEYTCVHHRATMKGVVRVV